MCFPDWIRKTTLHVEYVENVSLETCEFKNLEKINTTSAISFVNSTVHLVNSSIANCSLPEEGAILTVFHSNITFIRLAVVNNTGDNMKDIYKQYIIDIEENSRLYMLHCEFANNDIGKAAILILDSSEMLADSTKFFANYASSFIDLYKSNGVINSTEFTSKIACSSLGDCVSVTNGNLSVLNSVFRENGKGGNSPMLGCSFGSLQLQNVTFSGNNGGVLELLGCVAELETSIFINNTSVDDSSIVSVQKTNLLMTSSVLSNNTNVYTSILLRGSTVNISKCNFSHNSAEMYGRGFLSSRHRHLKSL